MIRSSRLLLAVALSGSVLGAVVVASPASAADATVTVSTSSAGTMLTQLSTNNAWSGMLDDVPAALSNFRALKAPLVRIHAGTDGGLPALPKPKASSAWSFANLDRLVNDSTGGGGDVLMNPRYAPDWMWTCTTYGAAGTIKDLTFQTYAQYLARLVSYYNKGSMTTETGAVITNPAGTANRITWWEPWNEPDLNNETPCAPPSGYGLTSAQYVTMWNAIVPAMLAVDPTLKFVGPATANGQFGSGGSDDYITKLMQGANVKPDALSFHGYGYWDNTVADKWIFDGDGTPGGGGIPLISDTAAAVHAAYPSTPIWITEVNVNADWGNDTAGRPWGAFGAAWWGSMMTQMAPRGVGMIHQYLVMESPQFGLVDDQTGAPTLPYWVQKSLNNAFPAGSTMLGSSSTLAGVQTLAVRKPDGNISVLVVNRQLNSATARGGLGLPAVVSVNLPGVTPTSVTLQQIDRNTSVATGPGTSSLPATFPAQVSLPGFGFAVFTVSDGTGPSPTPSPTPSTSPSASPTASSTASPKASPTASTTASPKPSTTGLPTTTPTGTSLPTSTGSPLPGGLTLTTSTAHIQPTQVALLQATAAPGSVLQLMCYSRPNTAYTVARTVTAVTGTATFSLKPGTNTRCYVRPANDVSAASNSVVINVHTTLSLSAVRNATPARSYTFQGRNLPRLAGQLITLYRIDAAGREIRTATTMTDASGIWRIARTFTGAGTYRFLVRTTQTLNNAPGVSSPYGVTLS